MSKEALIKSLQYSLSIYQDAVDFRGYSVSDFYKLLCKDGIMKGFCHHFRACFGDTYTPIITELTKDVAGTPYTFWYMPASAVVLHTVSDIQKFALQPRLDHLNRTIARLQNELLTPAA